MYAPQLSLSMTFTLSRRRRLRVSFSVVFLPGHIPTVQSNQVCAVQEAECAVQVAKLFSPIRGKSLKSLSPVAKVKD